MKHDRTNRHPPSAARAPRALVVSLLLIAFACWHPGQATTVNPLTVDDIIELREMGFTEPVIRSEVEAAGAPVDLDEEAFGRLLSDIDYTSVDEIKSIGLHQFIDSLQTRLNDVSGIVHETFFSIPISEATAGTTPQRRED